MPKGIPKSKNPGLNADTSFVQQQGVAPKQITHRKGGPHRVREEDKTNSEYDQYTYTHLLDETRERGVYRKDMKKAEMVKALLRDDESKKAEAQDLGTIERQEEDKTRKQKRQSEANEPKAQDETKRVQKGQNAQSQKHWQSINNNVSKRETTQAETQNQEEDKKEQDEREGVKKEGDKKEGDKKGEDSNDDDVGDIRERRPSPSLDDYSGLFFQPQVLYEESRDMTSTDSSSKSVTGPAYPDYKLRIYEWPFQSLPQSRPTRKKRIDLASMPYAPLKVVTIITEEKLVLPGQHYPLGKDPASVPILSLETKDAARQGILRDFLSGATIEKGTDWAKRTLVQGWNGHMYFYPPPISNGKDLAQVYREWSLKQRKTRRVKEQCDETPVEQENRRDQRRLNKMQRTIEIYEASQYRPKAICYVPAYLDFNPDSRPRRMIGKDARCTLEDLFFVRYPDCDVPHYYFWLHHGAQADPIISNSVSDPAAMQRQSPSIPAQTTNWKRTWVRVKKPNVAALGQMSPSSSVFCTASTAEIEYELYLQGLAKTLSKLKQSWLTSSKIDAWNNFAAPLSKLYPSGSLPETPQVHCSNITTPLAIKLARIEDLGLDEETPCSPFRGDEPWTRNDGHFWGLRAVDIDEADEAMGVVLEDNIDSDVLEF